MKNRRIFTLLAALGLTLGLASCQSSDSGKQEVRILVPSADHGWTGAVLTNAQSHADELNKKEGQKYNFVVTACESAEVQMNTVNDLEASSNIAGIVILPYDNTVESAITKLANGNIPFVMFDRIITNDAVNGSTSYVSGVKGDNEGIGKETAKKFIELGLQKTDKILVMPGDNSSVPELRNKGFYEELKAKGWSQTDIDSQIKSTDYTGWSREKGKKLFEDAQNTIKDYKWIFTHDSEISMGVLEALAGSTISEENKQAFKTNIKALGSSSGLEEMYQVIRGDHPRQSQYATYIENTTLFDVTYDPGMITSAIDDIVKHLNNEKVTKDHVIPVEVVDKSNVKNKTGFGGKVTA